MHEIRHLYFDENVSKEKISAECNEVAKQHSDCHGSLYNSIRFFDKVCDTYDEARAFIESHDRNDYDNIAVKYKETDGLTSKKLETLKEQKEKIRKQYFELDSVIYTDTVKSKLVTCKRCGSKISTEHWHRNTCPVCREDFRSETTLNRLKNLKQKHHLLEEKIEQELASISKKNKNAKIKWLVKIEYHT